VPALLVRNLPNLDKPLVRAPENPEPRVAAGVGASTHRVEDRQRDLTVSIDGSKEWMRYGYGQLSPESEEAYKRSLKKKKEAWEEKAVRTLFGRFLPLVEKYEGRLSATSKGVRYKFNKGWTMQMGFRPGLEIRYKFK
jgi:hypothetical protein